MNLIAQKTAARKRSPTSSEITFCFLVHGKHSAAGGRALMWVEQIL